MKQEQEQGISIEMLQQLVDNLLKPRVSSLDVFHLFKTPIGIFRSVATPDSVFEIKLLDTDVKGRLEPPRLPIHAEIEAQYKAYFAKKLKKFDLPLAMDTMTPFAQEVVKHLQEVPYGETTTYKELAALAGKPNNARAVGTVMAHNSWLIAVPCHRVLPVSGKIEGFSAPGGAVTKARLLKHEGHQIKHFQIVKDMKE